jgi:hypothetical protein
MNQLWVWTALRAVDGGSPEPSSEVPLSVEDQALVQDLELLELLEGAGDLELLHDLEVEP